MKKIKRAARVIKYLERLNTIKEDQVVSYSSENGVITIEIHVPKSNRMALVRYAFEQEFSSDELRIFEEMSWLRVLIN